MKKEKTIISLIIALSLVLCPAVASASETTTSQSDISQADTSSLLDNEEFSSLDDVVNEMEKQIESGEITENTSDEDLIEKIANMSGFSFKGLNSSLIQSDFSDLLDVKSVNESYGMLVLNMLGFDKSSLDSAEGLNSSFTALDLLNNTYGDKIEAMQVEEATLDTSNLDEMVASIQDIVNDSYNSVTSSSSFATAKNSVSIGSVFSKAKAGPGSYSLASLSSLSSSTKSAGASAAASAKSSFDSTTASNKKANTADYRSYVSYYKDWNAKNETSIENDDDLHSKAYGMNEDVDNFTSELKEFFTYSFQ